jgi:diadenylate cyclase
VSEETGNVSIAQGGELLRNVTAKELRDKLVELQNKKTETTWLGKWKGRLTNERTSEK